MESSKHQRLRDFRRRSIFDFCNTICHQRTHSITSLARARTVGDNLSPNALAMWSRLLAAFVVGLCVEEAQLKFDI
jgi:hypothetical protein